MQISARACDVVVAQRALYLSQGRPSNDIAQRAAKAGIDVPLKRRPVASAGPIGAGEDSIRTRYARRASPGRCHMTRCWSRAWEAARRLPGAKPALA